MYAAALLVALGLAQAKHLVSNSTAVEGKFRLVMGGSTNFNGILYEDYDGKNVVFITAAGINPASDAQTLENNFRNRGVTAAWCPIHSTNCNANVDNPDLIAQIEQADAIFLGGGQSGRLQSCLFGTYATNGAPTYVQTPILTALQHKLIVGGSSAGAMNQPGAEILVTGSSVESYAAVTANEVFWRPQGNGFFPSELGLADTHFSERGRQGRLLVLSAQLAREGRQNRWAFGVDEDTTFKWHDDADNTVEIIGTNGVVVYENAWDMNDAVMHFLTHGDRIVNGEIRMSPEKVRCTSSTTPGESNSVFSGVAFRTVSGAVAEFEERVVRTAYHGSPAVFVSFDNREAEAWCGGSYFGKSFTNLRVSMGRAPDYAFAENATEVMWEED